MVFQRLGSWTGYWSLIKPRNPKAWKNTCTNELKKEDLENIKEFIKGC